VHDFEFPARLAPLAMILSPEKISFSVAHASSFMVAVWKRCAFRIAAERTISLTFLGRFLHFKRGGDEGHDR
jgi:hypothetical protein